MRKQGAMEIMLHAAVAANTTAGQMCAVDMHTSHTVHSALFKALSCWWSCVLESFAVSHNGCKICSSRQREILLRLPVTDEETLSALVARYWAGRPAGALDVLQVHSSWVYQAALLASGDGDLCMPTLCHDAVLRCRCSRVLSVQ
jgi:hypothetical protein